MGDVSDVAHQHTQALENHIMKNTIRITRSLMLAGTALAIGLGTAAASPANIMFVVDASGSMKKDAGNGHSRMDNAKYAIANMLTDVDTSNKFGLTVYGHRRPRACDDIQLVANVGAVDAGFVNEYVQQLDPKGETPIAASVQMAAGAFDSFPDQNNQLVVVTDGIEECGGNVCDVATDLAANNIDLKVNVVGFTLNDQQKSLIRCLADETGGKFYDAQDAKALQAAFVQVKQDIAQPKIKAKPVSTGPSIWFEDEFDGNALGEHWTVENENTDGYVVEDGKLLVLFPDTGEPTNSLAAAENVFKLNADMPKGDWTMSTRFLFTSQTQSEWLRLGLSDGPEKSLLGAFQMFTYNYALTQVKLNVEKLGKGEPAGFTNQLMQFETRDLAERTAQFGEAIEGMLLKLEKKGRNYTVSGKLEGPADAKWVELQKMSSIRSPGKALTMAFGNLNNGYAPKGGEGYVEVDWVRVTTP